MTILNHVKKANKIQVGNLVRGFGASAWLGMIIDIRGGKVFEEWFSSERLKVWYDREWALKLIQNLKSWEEKSK